jgi:Mn-dependent DtxR family transcriptional regulator
MYTLSKERVHIMSRVMSLRLSESQIERLGRVARRHDKRPSQKVPDEPLPEPGSGATP